MRLSNAIGRTISQRSLTRGKSRENLIISMALSSTGCKTSKSYRVCNLCYSGHFYFELFIWMLRVLQLVLVVNKSYKHKKLIASFAHICYIIIKIMWTLRIVRNFSLKSCLCFIQVILRSSYIKQQNYTYRCSFYK